MLDRLKRSDDAPAEPAGGVATEDRPGGTAAVGDPAPADGAPERDERMRRRQETRDGAETRTALETARTRQRDEFGGINWGASFFGWLVAVGIAVLLTALLAAAGAAVGLTATTESEARSNAEEIGVGGGIALVVVLMLAYYAGGYVAGRMSRFDGGRQGLGTWAIGLVVTIVLALAAVVLGDQYNVLERLDLPALPVGEQTLATGGADRACRDRRRIAAGRHARREGGRAVPQTRRSRRHRRLIAQLSGRAHHMSLARVGQRKSRGIRCRTRSRRNWSPVEDCRNPHPVPTWTRPFPARVPAIRGTIIVASPAVPPPDTRMDA